MGSFNTSCFVSRQTIAPGEHCMVIPIIQQATYRPMEVQSRGEKSELYGISSSVCYPTRFWTPVGSFIEAKYDDYGRFELIDTPLNRYKLADYLREALEKTPIVSKGENEYHDLPCDLLSFMQSNTPGLLAVFQARGPIEPDTSEQFFAQCVQCWDYIFEVAGKHRLFWRHYTGILRPSQFAVMHSVSFETLVASLNAGFDWHKNSLDMRAVFDAAIEATDKSLDEFASKVANPELNPEQLEMITVFRWSDMFKRLVFRIGEGEGAIYPSEYEAFMDASMAYRKKQITKDDLFAAIKPWLAIRYAYTEMSGLNLHFEPMIYAGQDYENEIGRAYAKFIRKVAKKIADDHRAANRWED